MADRIAGEGGTALAIDLDVTDANSIASAVAAAEDDLGPISVLLNNAGIPPKDLSLEMDEAEWDAVMNTNLKGAWLMAREVGRRMVAHGHGGRIINIASVLGWRSVA